jgi:hypothetical protein
MGATVTADPGLPVAVNLNAYEGDSWSQMFRLLRAGAPVDLTSAIVRSECRSPSGDVYAMQCSSPDPTNGEVVLALPDVEPADYAYDIEVTDGGIVTTWITGRLRVRRGVTNE